jgi:hypothetical protein
MLVARVDLDVGIGVCTWRLQIRESTRRQGPRRRHRRESRSRPGLSPSLQRALQRGGYRRFPCETVRHLSTLASQPITVSGPGGADLGDRRATGGSEVAFRRREYSICNCSS